MAVVDGVDVEVLADWWVGGQSTIVELGWTPASLVDSWIGVGRLKREALTCNLSIFMALLWLHQRRTCHEWSHVLGCGTLNCWCTSPLVLPSWIDRVVMRGDRTPPCMPQQSLYLVCSIQIDCKGFVDNWLEGIYLVGVISCVSMSSRVAYLGVFLWFVIGLESTSKNNSNPWAKIDKSNPRAIEEKNSNLLIKT